MIKKKFLKPVLVEVDNITTKVIHTDDNGELDYSKPYEEQKKYYLYIINDKQKPSGGDYVLPKDEYQQYFRKCFKIYYIFLNYIHPFGIQKDNVNKVVATNEKSLTENSDLIYIPEYLVLEIIDYYNRYNKLPEYIRANKLKKCIKNKV